MRSLPGQVMDNRQYYLLKDQGKRMMMVMVITVMMTMMLMMVIIVMMVVMKKAGVMSNHLERLSEVEALTITGNGSAPSNQLSPSS